MPWNIQVLSLSFLFLFFLFLFCLLSLFLFQQTWQNNFASIGGPTVPAAPEMAITRVSLLCSICNYQANDKRGFLHHILLSFSLFSLFLNLLSLLHLFSYSSASCLVPTKRRVRHPPSYSSFPLSLLLLSLLSSILSLSAIASLRTRNYQATTKASPFSFFYFSVLILFFLLLSSPFIFPLLSISLSLFAPVLIVCQLFEAPWVYPLLFVLHLLSPLLFFLWNASMCNARLMT